MLYLQDAVYLNSETRALTTGHMAVEEGPMGRITLNADIPPASERMRGDRVFHCAGKLVTGSLACGHHHIYSALARGMPPAARAPQNFVEILEYVWWRLDKCLDADMIAASALVTGLHLLKNGVTFCIDHHASPFAIDGSLDIIARALDRVGVGHLLCYETSCRDGDAIAEMGLAENERYLRAGGKGHVGLHASFTVSDEILRRSVDLAASCGTGIHIHVAEAASDMEQCLKIHGKTVVRRLKDAGALDLPHTILGHCVHITDEDRQLLAEAPCWIVQNTESNMNNNVGLAGYGSARNVMLGTDGMHSDMIRSAHAAYLAGISVEGITCADAYGRLRAVHRHAKMHEAPGNGANNLMVLAYDSPTPLTQENALGHFFYGITSRHVHTVISQGRIVVEDRMYCGDEAGILEFSHEQAQRLWAKLA